MLQLQMHYQLSLSSPSLSLLAGHLRHWSLGSGLLKLSLVSAMTVCTLSVSVSSGCRVLTEQLPAKELQRRGVCLIKLRLAERSTGLYGRTVATFQPFWPGKDLPSHNFTPGNAGRMDT